MIPLVQRLQQKLSSASYRRILRISERFSLAAFPFMLVYIYSLNRTNIQLRSLLDQQARSVHELSSVKGEIKELLAREKKSVVILDAFNAHVNDILKNQILESKRVLGSSSISTASSEGVLGISPLGLLQIHSKTTNEIPIYDSPLKSRVLAQMMPEEIMFYYKKSDGWYEVELKSQVGEKGWVEAQNIVELPR